MPETLELTDDQRLRLAQFDQGETPERITKRKTARAYYEGTHATQLTDRQREYLQIRTGQEFNDNYCPVVVDALSERLVVTGFTIQGKGEAAQDTVQEQIAQWWKLARMDQVQHDVHTSAICDGDAYLLAEWNQVEGRPAWSFERAYDGLEGMEIHYDDNKRPEYASKRWQSGEATRLNLYYPDRVEKFVKQDGNWKLFEPVQLWQVGAIPVVHFKNKASGYNYGKSELHDVIPQQNALNKAIIDLIAAADTTAFRLYWATGVDMSEFRITPGAMLSTEQADARFGHIPGEDLSQLIEYKDAFAVEVARISRTPQAYFQISGQVAAEGTLKQQESGLVSRAKNRQVSFGDAWEDAVKLAIKLWNAYGSQPALDDTVSIETQWKDPETRNGAEFLAELKSKRDLGIPDEMIWAEAGYTAEQIATIKESEQYKLSRIKALFEAADKAGVDPGTLAKVIGWTEAEINELYAGLVEEQPEEQPAQPGQPGNNPRMMQNGPVGQNGQPMRVVMQK